MKPASFFNGAALAATLGALCAVGAPLASPSIAATPPPTPPPITAPATSTSAVTAAPLPATAATASPIAIPPGFNLPGAAHPAVVKPTPTPPSSSRVGISGVWEVALQRPNSTTYTHLKLVQNGTVLAGTYRDQAGKPYPLAGSVDGTNVRLVVSMPNGTTIVIEGRLDGTTDMIGMLTTPKTQIPFSADYRPKEKWIDNVNAAPGGFGGTGAGNPP